MQKVLITGSSGHLGSHSLRVLSASCEVHAIVRDTPANPIGDTKYHELDFFHNWELDQLPNSIDTIIHLAQSRGYSDFPGRALECFKVNTESTARLLEYARSTGVKRFILASTGGLYEPGENTITESSNIKPPKGDLAYYFRSKLSAEMLSEPYSRFFDVIILRPFFIYGPGQSSEKLIPRLIASVRDHKPIRLTGKEGLRLNPIYVGDAAKLLHSLLNVKGSQIFNVAGPEVVTIRRIAEEIGRLLGIEPVFEHASVNSESIVADYLPISKLLEGEMTLFNDGLQSMLDAQ